MDWNAKTALTKIVLPLLVGVGLAFLFVPRGGGNDTQILTMSEAFCNDLNAGYAPFSILMPLVRDETYTPEAMADRAYVWASRDCPEHLLMNEPLRYYLQQWGIDPNI